ncbi:MAG TPA: ROK family protein [Albitalea sp.]|uniref:ROK family transcriptional regulator n=1 Tax=Piscinibacter sp. TaxID=1903157 RepID=UPI002ED03B70
MPTPAALPIQSRFLRTGEHRVASESERWMLELVRRAGTVSRADLTRASGLSVPGAKGLIDGLVERGLLQLGPPVTRGRGQPSATVSLVPTFAYCLGLSILVDGYGLALMDLSGKVLDQRLVTAFPLGLEHVATQVPRDAGKLLRSNGVAPDSVFGVGLSMTGPRTGSGSRVNPPLLLSADWADAHLDHLFAERLQLPVWMDNDANCAALAECLFGVGREYSNFVYLHFTDGFAAGLISEGKLLRGAHGNAGEMGRLFALAGMTRPTLESLRRRLVASGRELPDLHTMLDRYEPAWRQIDTWIEEVRESVTVAVAAAVALFDPRAVVFGSRLPPDLARRLIAKVRFEQRPRRGIGSPNPTLVVGQIEKHAAMIGAAAMPFKEHFFA